MQSNRRYQKCYGEPGEVLRTSRPPSQRRIGATNAVSGTREGQRNRQPNPTTNSRRRRARSASPAVAGAQPGRQWRTRSATHGNKGMPRRQQAMPTSASARLPAAFSASRQQAAVARSVAASWWSQRATPPKMMHWRRCQTPQQSNRRTCQVVWSGVRSVMFKPRNNVPFVQSRPPLAGKTAT